MENHFQTCKDLYKDQDLFWKDIRSFLEFGHVYGDSRFFGLACPVNGDDDDLHMGQDLASTDAWYIHLFAGSMDPFGDLLESICSHRWILFSRLKNGRSGPIKKYDFNILKRRTTQWPTSGHRDRGNLKGQ